MSLVCVFYDTHSWVKRSFVFQYSCKSCPALPTQSSNVRLSWVPHSIWICKGFAKQLLTQANFFFACICVWRYCICDLTLYNDQVRSNMPSSDQFWSFQWISGFLRGSQNKARVFYCYLLDQVWCLWSCHRDIYANDDNVWNTGPYPDDDGPGHREGQHCIYTQGQEEEKCHLWR